MPSSKEKSLALGKDCDLCMTKLLSIISLNFFCFPELPKAGTLPGCYRPRPKFTPCPRLVSLQKGGVRDPGDSCPISLPCRSCFCLGHGHQLPAGHGAGGRCLESCGDDRQTAGEPCGLICVQRGPAHSLTSQGQGRELMKPLRAWLLAPPSSVLEQGSHDNYRLLQASPGP